MLEDSQEGFLHSCDQNNVLPVSGHQGIHSLVADSLVKICPIDSSLRNDGYCYPSCMGNACIKVFSVCHVIRFLPQFLQVDFIVLISREKTRLIQSDALM